MDNASVWNAISGGLGAASEQLTALQLRRMAEEERRLAREEREREAALRRVQLEAEAAARLRGENFQRVGKQGDKDTQRRILTDLAMKRKNEEYTDPVSGDVYIRGEGESPLAIQQAQKQRDAELRAQLAEQAAMSRAEVEKLRQEAMNNRWVNPSGNVQVQEQGRNQRWETVSGNVSAQQAGANARAAMSQQGMDRRQGNATTGKKTEAQAKAETFSGLMSAAESELSRNPWGSKPLSAPMEIALKSDGKGLTGNAMAALARSRMSPEQQRAVQSRTQFTQAALYAFSGQAAPDNEVAKNIAIFFPQSGETDPTVIQQKARMRATATMLLEKRKAGLIDGAVPLSADAATGGNALSQLNSIGRP